VTDNRNWIDLRSDTVTRPSPAMRRAMAAAEVGDDVLEEDPTVLRLQATAAERLGCEAALFVPSGTMGNQIALHLMGRPGDEVICESRSHILHFELGAMAALSGLLPRAVETPDGRLEPAQIERHIVAASSLRNPTAVLEVENSANLAGGTVYTAVEQRALLDVAAAHGLATHLDGARLFNAAAATGEDVADLARGFDTVMISLSKGLGAPVGSLLFGSAERMRDARRVRKMFGGGMRQVGVLAAAGLVALEEGPPRILEDHALARRLAEGIAELRGFEVDLDRVRTNIVLVRPLAGSAGDVRERIHAVLHGLRRRDVLATSLDGGSIRFVTHRDVDARGIGQALQALQELQ
jgi:threonine aldolase